MTIENEIVELWYELVKTQEILKRVVNGQYDFTKKDINECEHVALQSLRNRFPGNKFSLK